jgi:PAS domain S-box-containing protein
MEPPPSPDPATAAAPLPVAPAWPRDRVQQRLAQLSALHETSLRLIARLDRRELLEAILEGATLITATRHGYIYLLEAGTAEMQMRVGKGVFSNLLGQRVAIGQGVGGKVWQSGRPLTVDDYRCWPHRLHRPGLERLRAVIGIPLKTAGSVIGVIGLASTRSGKRFGAEDLWVLSRFADLALLALDKANLYEELKRELGERQLTEQTLRESEKRYRQFLESSPDPIVVYDLDGNATYLNPAFEQTFGWTRDELLGRTIDFVPARNLPETRKAIENMLRGEKIQLFQTRRLTRDGRELDVQLSSTVYYDRHGRQVGNIVTLRDISALKHAEQAVVRYQERLEELVAERTAELAKTNAHLAQEIKQRIRIEATLRRREKELEAQSLHLEEMNTALKVLLKQRENDKQELGEGVLSNMKELVQPYLERLKQSRLAPTQRGLVEIMAANLEHITSPFVSRLSSRYFNLTPTEIRVVSLVKEGKTSKEIAALLCLAKNTILFHRQNIRGKLGLRRSKQNLRSHLLTFEK